MATSSAVEIERSYIKYFKENTKDIRDISRQISS
jgi:hypothetical protein